MQFHRRSLHSNLELNWARQSLGSELTTPNLAFRVVSPRSRGHFLGVPFVDLQRPLTRKLSYSHLRQVGSHFIVRHASRCR